MCGIAGNISLGKRKINNFAEVEEMLEIMKHRGPDDRGICFFDFQNGKVGNSKEYSKGKDEGVDGIIGFDRLSILDLSTNGHQPMISENKDIILAFNGEIYNAFDFKPELERKGYKFKSNTDTEVILHLYQEYGFDKTITLLNGMFAIVIVDINMQTVYMARDRFGIKPFYYMILNGKILFASEMKCLLCDEEFNPEVDYESLYEHFVYSGTDSKNLLKGVENLLPGEILTYKFGNAIKRYKFFDIDSYNRPPRVTNSKKHYQKQMEQILRKAVKRQMISDVKVGCQLSGGIDSTLVTTYASQQDSGLEDTISVVFDNDNRSFSEEEYIDQVNDTLNVKSHKYIIDRNYVAEKLIGTIWHLDSMANTSNSIGIMLLSEKAKENVTVLLSGEGADEAFAGYWQFSLAPILEKYWQLRNNPIGHILLSPFRRFDNGELSVHMKDGYENFVTTTFGVTDKNIFSKMFLLDSQKSKQLYDDEVTKRKEVFRGFKGTNFDKHIKYMMTTNLPDLLTRQDKMSMSASIENRVPFLDNEVIDYAFSLPRKVLLKWIFSFDRLRNLKMTEGKYILKLLCVNLYGKTFTFRGKRGFDLPLSDFLSNDEFQDYFFREIIPGMERHKILNAEYAGKLYKKIHSINSKESLALWKMVNFEIWCQLFIDKKYKIYFGA